MVHAVPRDERSAIMTHRSRSFLLGLAALAAAVLVVPARAKDASVTFHANGINMSNVGRPGLLSLDIAIERWTTPAELSSLRDALLEKGSDGLLRELQKVKPR